MPIDDLTGGNLLHFTEDYLINIVFAVLVLALGLAIVFFSIYAIRAFILRKLKINYLFAKLTGRVEPVLDLEKLILRLYFLVALLFVFNISAQVAHFNGAIDFFSSVLGWLGEVGKLVFQALVPITLALVFSYLARAGVQLLGKSFNIDEKLGKRLDAGEPVQFSLTKSLSEIAYGLVFLYFIPQILTGVGLEKLSGPITLMFDEVVPFFSRLAGAIVIFGLGWFIAGLLKQIIESLLVSLGVDKAVQNMFGDNNLISSIKLSKVIPSILYALVIILVSVQTLAKLNLDTITAPIEKLLLNLADIILPVTVAVLVIFAAVYFGGLFAKFVSGLLKDVGFDNIYSKLGLTEIKTGAKSPSQIVGLLASATIIILVTMQCLNSLGLENLSDVLRTLIVQFGNVMLGVVVFGIGLYVARSVSIWIEQGIKLNYAKFLALVARVVIIVISGAMALQQIGIADEIVTIAFALSMGSIALGVAIAIGLGAKDIAGEVAKDFVNKFRQ